MASVTKRFNLSNPQYPRVNYDGVYFSEYKVSLEQQGIDVVNDIKEKTQ
jgi:hypothetical protein